MTEYLVIYETDDAGGWCAYAPDLGCYAAGRTREEVDRLIREAIPLHLETMREEGLPVPEPYHSAATIAA
jgi:predicted RNase H-like HicB family nuclease